MDRHLFDHLSADPAEWTDIARADANRLAAAWLPSLLTQVRDQPADAGTTVKTLWRLVDGSLVESVLMRYGVRGLRASGQGRERATVCISSQAGCGMACPFCATGQGGLQRNLTAAEIVLQVIDAARRLRDAAIPGGPGHLNNIVFMGMGEPMANYKAVLAAIRAITAPTPAGLGISARGVTLSTVGLVPRIRQLADRGPAGHLGREPARPGRRTARRAVPDQHPLERRRGGGRRPRLLHRHRRRVSIEYALIRDINDQAWRADALADVLRRTRPRGWVHVNLIPLNPTPGSKWTASRRSDEAEFVRRLQAAGVQVTVRDTRGREIDGACGQLAATDRVEAG